ncbi:MAG: hypothetical protein JW966_11795 [Anaerolineae bacterium]|nr:hypothetical protein [Anaerolineae bacterium]
MVTASLGLAGLLAACTLVTATHTPDGLPSVTPLPVTGSPVSPAAPTHTPALTALETLTGPYPDESSLLDGVCYEYLYTMNNETWMWRTPGDLSAFYDRVDASELCPGLVRRGTADFDGRVLIGIVNVMTGCDAAHRVLDLVDPAPDSAVRAQTLIVELAIRSGCDYELVQPLLIALPRPPDDVPVHVVVVPAAESQP